MGTKPAPLGSGDRMWMRASRGAQGCACWVIGPAVPDGFNAALYQTVEARKPAALEVTDGTQI